MSRRVLFNSIATRALVLIAALAWRLLVMWGCAYFKVDPVLAERMLDIGRMTMGRNIYRSR